MDGRTAGFRGSLARRPLCADSPHLSRFRSRDLRRPDGRRDSRRDRLERALGGALSATSSRAAGRDRDDDRAGSRALGRRRRIMPGVGRDARFAEDLRTRPPSAERSPARRSCLPAAHLGVNGRTPRRDHLASGAAGLARRLRGPVRHALDGHHDQLAAAVPRGWSGPLRLRSRTIRLRIALAPAIDREHVPLGRDDVSRRSHHHQRAGLRLPRGGPNQGIGSRRSPLPAPGNERQ
jgi:hypothetical protein